MFYSLISTGRLGYFPVGESIVLALDPTITRWEIWQRDCWEGVPVIVFKSMQRYFDVESTETLIGFGEWTILPKESIIA